MACWTDSSMSAEASPASEPTPRAFENPTLSYPRHPDHDEIMRNLKILAKAKIDVARILPFTLDPCLAASLYLLGKINGGSMKPSYLVNAQTVPDEYDNFSAHPRRSTDSETSEVSQLSGNTLTAYGAVPLPTALDLHSTQVERTSSNPIPVFILPSQAQSISETSPFHKASFCPNLDFTLAGTPSLISDGMDVDSDYGVVTPRPWHSISGTPFPPDEVCPSRDVKTSTSLLPESHSTFTESLSRHADDPPLRETNLASHSSMPDSLAVQVCQVYEHYQGPPPEKQGYRSPCPYCAGTFETHSNFVKHIDAVHEHPKTFTCMHPALGRRFCRVTTRASEHRRHHTIHHSKDCNMSDCFVESKRPYPKRIWGCWMCKQLFFSVDEWAEHHIAVHFGCLKQDLSFTTLVQSLLLQNKVNTLWSRIIRNLTKSTQQIWELEWSRKQNGTKELVEALETGFYRQQNILQNDQLLQVLVTELFNAAQKTPLQTNAPSKRPAPSPPPAPKPVSAKLPRAVQHRSSRSGLSQPSNAAHDDALQSDFARVTMNHMRAVRRQDSHSTSDK